MRRALNAMVIEGIKTTIPLHEKILDDPDFRQETLDGVMEDVLSPTAFARFPGGTASGRGTGGREG